MNKQKFVEILRNPEAISTTDFSELEVLAKENPYFQSGHIVIARASRILKSPQSAKKINTAAIYATNRNSLKSYMQGHGEVSTTQTAKTIATPKKENNPTPIKTNKQDNTLSTTPKILGNTENDRLIRDIYSNLEGWKKSRNQFLEFEKLSDELETSTKKEKLDDAVEKIKNQIEEEVNAEDKILNDQIEKIETTHSVKEEENTTVKNEAKEDLKKDEIEESPKPNLETEKKPIIEDSEDEEKEKSSGEKNVKENAIVEEPSPEENFNATDFLQSLREHKEEIDSSKSVDNSEENNDVAIDDEPVIDNVEIEENQDVISTIESTEKPEEEPITVKSENLDTHEEDALVEDKNTKSNEEPTFIDADSKENIVAKKSTKKPKEKIDAIKSIESKSDAPVSDIADNELTSKLIDEEIEKAILDAEDIKVQEKPDEIVVESVSKITETTNISTDEDVDEKDPSLEEKVNLKPRAGKSNKKFRLSVLNRRKGKKILSPKNKLTPENKKEVTPKTEGKSDNDESKKKPIKLKIGKSLISKKSSLKKSTEVKKKTIKTDISLKKKVKPKPTNDKITSQSVLIDSFLKANPTIKAEKNKLESEQIDLSENSAQFPKEAITETLAKILVNQEKKESAIRVYRELILLHPKKESYYQSKIDSLESSKS